MCSGGSLVEDGFDVVRIGFEFGAPFSGFGEIGPIVFEESFLEIAVAEAPGIIDLSHGPNVSTEGLDNGFTNSFVITFESVAARDAYLPHPVHQKAVDYVVPKLEKVIVIDHEVNEQVQ